MANSKFGVHVNQGSRNGYGPVAAAGPALVVAVAEGGSLIEAKNLSPNTITVYRDQVVYTDAPPGIDQTNEAGARAMADQYWPALENRMILNPADYYQWVNETGGTDPKSIRNIIAYETRLMELAERDGYKLAVGSMAAGAPHLSQWVEFYLPFLTRAQAGGHVYSRHVYGGVMPGGHNMLTRLLADGTWVAGDEITERPFTEANILSANNIGIPMLLTECGQNGGFLFPGVEEFIADSGRYDALCQAFPNILGMAMWTYGQWEGDGSMNIEAASAAMVDYLDNWVSTEPPEPPEPPQSDLATALWAESIARQPISLNPDAALQKAIFSRSGRFTPVESEFRMTHDSVRYVAQAGEDIETGERLVWYTVDAPPWSPILVTDGTDEDTSSPLDGLKFHAPMNTVAEVTSWFDEPRDYPGDHEGIDFAPRPQGTTAQALAVMAGQVNRVRVSLKYGNYVVTDHVYNGVPFSVYYAHLAETLVSAGAPVTAGQPVGKVGTSGNSSAVHLHITLQALGLGLPGYVVPDVLDPAPFYNIINDLVFPSSPPTATYDLADYLKGDGRLYEVVYRSGGQQSQERMQTQFGEQSYIGPTFYQTKNAQWEEMAYDQNFIYRGIDTSPGPDSNGRPRYYSLHDDDLAGWSRWMTRFAVVGEVYTRSPLVQYWNKDTCEQLPGGGRHVSNLKFAAYHDSWNSGEGITVEDVLELHWLDVNGAALERYFYARDFGLVGWRSASGAASGISEIHAPGTRPDNVREIIDCLD